MIGTAARAGCILMVAENVHYDAVYRRMAALIAEGAIGAPFLCRDFRGHHMHDDLRQRPWFFTDPAGGIMWSGGIHDIETVRMLMADAPFVEVYATAARKTLTKMETDNTSLGIFLLAGGGVAFLSPPPARCGPAWPPLSPLNPAWLTVSRSRRNRSQHELCLTWRTSRF